MSSAENHFYFHINRVSELFFTIRNPASVQISTGDTVRWTNMDSDDLYVGDSIFKSDIQGQSCDFFDYTFFLKKVFCPEIPHLPALASEGFPKSYAQETNLGGVSIYVSFG